MKKERQRNKPLPWGRDKHLLFNEEMAIALQGVQKCEEKKVQKDEREAQEGIHIGVQRRCQDQSVSNVQSIPIKMPL